MSVWRGGRSGEKIKGREGGKDAANVGRNVGGGKGDERKVKHMDMGKNK